MSVKSISTRFKIVGRSPKCKGGKSAVEQSSYISRTILKCDYDGRTYYPKYSEDLVHTEILLPKNAPEEYKDRAILWNSVEMKDKNNSKAQLARSMRLTLPNDWSYEVAIEAMEKYCKENFVDRGMCCEYAIHDSEHNGQRNLHCHILLTLRPILEDGSWGDKQKKEYILDENGNKVRTKSGNYKCKTIECTDWNRKENAKLWRTNLRVIINEYNSKLDINDTWDERSYQEQGVDLQPQLHLGTKATALERKGVATERGDINRSIIAQNAVILGAKAVYEKAKKALEDIKNVEVVSEILEMLKRIKEMRGTLQLPLFGAATRKIRNRSDLQNPDFIAKKVEGMGLNTFAELDETHESLQQRFNTLEKQRQAICDEANRCGKLLEAYDFYKPYKDIVTKSNSLKGIAKIRYDREHKNDLDYAPIARVRLSPLLKKGEKIQPKAWKDFLEKAQAKLDATEAEYSKLVSELAVTEVVEHNHENFERYEAQAKQKELAKLHKMQKQQTRKKYQGIEV